MMKINFKKLFFVFCTTMIMGCSIVGDSTGTSESFVQLKISTDPSSTTIGNGLGSNTFEYTLAKVVLSEIEFQDAENCDEDNGEIQFQGPFVVNLLNQKSVPDLDQIKLANKNYCKFKFKLDKLDEEEIPSGISTSDEVVGLSVLIKGNYNTSTPFEVRLDRNEDYELGSEESGGFDIGTNSINTIFLVFDLSKLFEGVDLSSPSIVLSSGTILIDKDNNKDTFDVIKENLKKFSKLQKDTNENDSLDSNDDVVADGDTNN